jgi:hypothetical protein
MWGLGVALSQILIQQQAQADAANRLAYEAEVNRRMAEHEMSKQAGHIIDIPAEDVRVVEDVKLIEGKRD